MRTRSPGTLVCVSPATKGHSRTPAVSVECVFREWGRFDVRLLRVAIGGHHGPWQARRWKLWTQTDGTPRREMRNGVLTQNALESLALHVVSADSQPRRDARLPAPVCVFKRRPFGSVVGWKTDVHPLPVVWVLGCGLGLAVVLQSRRAGGCFKGIVSGFQCSRSGSGSAGRVVIPVLLFPLPLPLWHHIVHNP